MKHKLFLLILGFFALGSGYSQSDQVVLNNELILNSLANNRKISSTNTWKLSATELDNIKEQMNQCILTYNIQTLEAFKSRGERRHAKMYQIMKLENYKIQIVPYMNEKGQKEIWINGFCDAFQSNWHKEIIQVFDGGNCYFRIRLNLDSGECLEAGTNGYA